MPLVADYLKFHYEKRLYSSCVSRNDRNTGWAGRENHNVLSPCLARVSVWPPSGAATRGYRKKCASWISPPIITTFIVTQGTGFDGCRISPGLVRWFELNASLACQCIDFKRIDKIQEMKARHPRILAH